MKDIRQIVELISELLNIRYDNLKNKRARNYNDFNERVPYEEKMIPFKLHLDWDIRHLDKDIVFQVLRNEQVGRAVGISITYLPGPINDESGMSIEDKLKLL